MRNIDFKKIIQDRKTLYLILSIVMVSVFTLSIAYAAMSTVLEIHGASEVVASTWDIYLDNVEVNSNSVSDNVPVISGSSTLTFDVDLNIPGDFYEFKVDVVNDGSIDAMIDSVIKTPELTSEQAKYIKYEVSYANGESISSNQTLEKGTSTPIKVRVEYRKDLVASDLPSTATELSLKLTLVYVQSDGSGSNIINNGSALRVVSGDINTIGSEVCIGTECFYVYDNDGAYVRMLAKYNLHVGYRLDGSLDKNVSTLQGPTGIQDKSALGATWNFNNSLSSAVAIFPRIGIIYFSETYYWLTSSDSLKSKYGTSYPAYVFDSNSSLYSYVVNYRKYLENLYAEIYDVRLITVEELYELGCEYSSCDAAPAWVQSTSYWSGSAITGNKIIYRVAAGAYEDGGYDALYIKANGIRPVVEIPVSEF